MQRLGYLRKNTQGVSSVITSDELRQAIRDYQEAFNIPVTGKTGRVTPAFYCYLLLFIFYTLYSYYTSIYCCDSEDLNDERDRRNDVFHVN